MTHDLCASRTRVRDVSVRLMAAALTGATVIALYKIVASSFKTGADVTPGEGGRR